MELGESINIDRDERENIMRLPLINYNCTSPNSLYSETSESISSLMESDNDNGCAENLVELVQFDNETFSLPRDLCENPLIFHEFLSMETWKEIPVQLQNHLKQFLPTFSGFLNPQLAAIEQNRTISMFFNDELIRFGRTPLKTLQKNLEIGNYRPDILKLRKIIDKSKRREQRFRHCERVSYLAKQLFISRQQLLDTAYQSSPDTNLKIAPRHSSISKPLQLQVDDSLFAIRARKRFYKEINQITEKLGLQGQISDEEDDDYSTIMEDVVDETLLSDSIKSPTLPERCIYDTLFTRHQKLDDDAACRMQQKSKLLRLCNRNFKQYLRGHKRRKLTQPTLPEFETSDIRLRDVCARAHIAVNFKRIFPTGRKSKAVSTNSIADDWNQNESIKSISAPVNISSSNSYDNFNTSKLVEMPALVPIKSTKTFQKQNNNTCPIVTADTHPSLATQLDSNTLSSYILEPQTSSLMSASSQQDMYTSCLGDTPLLTENHEAFNVLDGDVVLQDDDVNTSFSDIISNNVNLSITPPPLSSSPLTTDLKSHSLLKNPTQTHSMPKLKPISKLPATTISSLMPSTSRNSFNNNIELVPATCSCFFSLLRNFFCSTSNHRMRYEELSAKIDIWMKNPTTKLNDWYMLSDNWSLLLRSAVNFLVGDFLSMPDDYVPYIEYKNQINIYQWIGAGRDSDHRLKMLCDIWWEKRDQYNKTIPDTLILRPEQKSVTVTQVDSIVDNNQSIVMYDNGSGNMPSPPPPRCPTTWTVRPASAVEITEFQRQERERFEQPHKAYTYRMHGYESVVGPVKGIYTPMLALTKARGHSMMVCDRPNFVTILTLVRDATARLPNGEGTRADISELLKCSQYINRDAAENVLQTIVSGALDRMHTEHDPCVRYDAKRKIWIYLHRNRCEKEFERIHLQNQGLHKPKKIGSRKSKSSNKVELAVTEGSTATKATIQTCNPIVSTLPALVPSNSMTKNVAEQKQLYQHQNIVTSKYLPVPPLKYNIPPSTSIISGQKSLLKTVLIHENNVSSGVQSLPTGYNPPKQLNFQITGTKSSVDNNFKTPTFLVASNDIQSVHTSNNNCENVASTVCLPSTSRILQNQESSVLHATISPQIGKNTHLNKPIVVNQISTTKILENSKLNNKPSHSEVIKQTNLTYPNKVTQAQHNYIIPISAILTNTEVSKCQSNQMPSVSNPITVTATVNTLQSPMQISSLASISKSTSLLSNKNFIRLVSAPGIKPIFTASTGQVISKQPILAKNNLTNSQKFKTTTTPTAYQIVNNSINNNCDKTINTVKCTNSLLAITTSNVNTTPSTYTTPSTSSFVKLAQPLVINPSQQKTTICGGLQQQKQQIILKNLTGTTTLPMGQKGQRLILIFRI